MGWRLFRSLCVAGALDRRENRLQVFHDLGVREPNHVNPLGSQPLGPGGVVGRLIGFGVGIPVDFDSEPAVCAVEIGDDATQQNVLTADVDAELMVAEALPQPRLCGREGVAKVPRTTEDEWGNAVEK